MMEPAIKRDLSHDNTTNKRHKAEDAPMVDQDDPATDQWEGFVHVEECEHLRDCEHLFEHSLDNSFAPLLAPAPVLAGGPVLPAAHVLSDFARFSEGYQEKCGKDEDWRAA